MVNRVTAVLGCQWGDEGKGKCVDILMGSHDICLRFNGGANAGHTIEHEGKKFALHLLPSGIVREGTINVIGNGCVVHVKTLLSELEQFDDKETYISRLRIAEGATLVLDIHQLLDAITEESMGIKIGTTKRGIGPAYVSKINRSAVRAIDLRRPEVFAAKVRSQAAAALQAWPESQSIAAYDVEEEIQRHITVYAPILQPQLVKCVLFIADALNANKRILAEGANAALLDIDHGTYPFVTSSSCSAGGICTGSGLPPSAVGETIGVAKAYATRVGGGPFITEQVNNSEGQHLQVVGREFGTTTGRARRCGWLDLPQLQFTSFINGVTALNLTKLDVLGGMKTIKACIAYVVDGVEMPPNWYPSSVEEHDVITPVYEELQGWEEDISRVKTFEELPEAARNYVQFIEGRLGLKCVMIGVGPNRDEVINRAK